MDNGYIVRFIRKDDRPVEEFFYHTFEDATSHLLLFRDDDSDLYARIEIIDGATEKQFQSKSFSVSGLWFHKRLHYAHIKECGLYWITSGPCYWTKNPKMLDLFTASCYNI